MEHFSCIPESDVVSGCTHAGILLTLTETTLDFGSIRDGKFQMTLDAEIARECWMAMPAIYPCVTLDVFTFLPREFRAILHDKPCARRGSCLESAVAWFMRESAEQLKILRGKDLSVWGQLRLKKLTTERDLEDERISVLLRLP